MATMGTAGTTGGVFVLDTRETKNIGKIIDRIERAGGNVRRPLKQWLVYMDRQTIKTFDDGGRGSVEWKKLADVTVIMRKYRHRGGSRTNPRRILQDTGHLKSQTKTTIKRIRGVDTAVLFNLTPYGKTHQFGGKIRIPARTIRPKKPGGVLVFEINGQTIFSKYAHQPAKTKDVPKRPFLFIEPRDEQFAFDRLSEHARNIEGKI